MGLLPASARLVDSRNRFLIPGLWDMHAHIQGNEKAWLPLYIANGVTGIRDMGADLDFILDIREAASSGRTFGPRIVAAGPSSMTRPRTGRSGSASRPRMRAGLRFSSSSAAVWIRSRSTTSRRETCSLRLSTRRGGSSCRSPDTCR